MAFPILLLGLNQRIIYDGSAQVVCHGFFRSICVPVYVFHIQIVGFQFVVIRYFYVASRHTEHQTVPISVGYCLFRILYFVGNPIRKRISFPIFFHSFDQRMNSLFSTQGIHHRFRRTVRILVYVLHRQSIIADLPLCVQRQAAFYHFDRAAFCVTGSTSVCLGVPSCKGITYVRIAIFRYRYIMIHLIDMSIFRCSRRCLGIPIIRNSILEFIRNTIWFSVWTVLIFAVVYFYNIRIIVNPYGEIVCFHKRISRNRLSLFISNNHISIFCRFIGTCLKNRSCILINMLNSICLILSFCFYINGSILLNFCHSNGI